MAKDTTSLIGRKFGHWTVIAFDRVDTHGIRIMITMALEV